MTTSDLYGRKKRRHRRGRHPTTKKIIFLEGMISPWLILSNCDWLQDKRAVSPQCHEEVNFDKI